MVYLLLEQIEKVSHKLEHQIVLEFKVQMKNMSASS